MPTGHSRSAGALPWIPLVALSTAAAYLAARYDDIPERWPVHWDLAGNPNGESTRSIPGVFGLLVLGLVIWVLLEIMAAVMLARGKPELLPVRIANVRLMRMVSASTSVLFAGLSVSLPLGPHVPPVVIVVLAFALIGAPLALGSRRLKQAMAEVRAAGHADAVRGYHGLYYSNPDDARLWVPKLGGGGLTVNFAHRWAWPVVVLLVVAPPVVAVGAMLVLSHR